MRRVLLVVALAVVLSGCSISINGEGPPIVIVSTETNSLGTPDADDFLFQWGGTMSVSGSLVRHNDDGTCFVVGVIDDIDGDEILDINRAGTNVIWGNLRTTSSATSGGACQFDYRAFTTFEGNVELITGLVAPERIFVSFNTIQAHSGDGAEPLDFAIET